MLGAEAEMEGCHDAHCVDAGCGRAFAGGAATGECRGGRRDRRDALGQLGRAVGRRGQLVEARPRATSAECPATWNQASLHQGFAVAPGVLSRRVAVSILRQNKASAGRDL